MNLIKIQKEPDMCILIGENTIDRNTLPKNLQGFFITKSVKANVGDEKDVPVQFGTCTFDENGLSINIGIRFETNHIVSLSISIPQFDNNYDPNIEWDFYNKIPEREKEYEKWLVEHINFKITNFDTSFTEHGIGVGRNKSEDTFILATWR